MSEINNQINNIPFGSETNYTFNPGQDTVQESKEITLQDRHEYNAYVQSKLTEEKDPIGIKKWKALQLSRNKKVMVSRKKLDYYESTIKNQADRIAELEARIQTLTKDPNSQAHRIAKLEAYIGQFDVPATREELEHELAQLTI